MKRYTMIKENGLWFVLRPDGIAANHGFKSLTRARRFLHECNMELVFELKNEWQNWKEKRDNNPVGSPGWRIADDEMHGIQHKLIQLLFED